MWGIVGCCSGSANRCFLYHEAMEGRYRSMVRLNDNSEKELTETATADRELTSHDSMENLKVKNTKEENADG